MSFFGRLFGSEKAISTASAGIDKAFYTSEEKADQFTKLLALYEPFKLAQRMLAMTVAIPFVLIHVLTAISWLLSAFLVEDIERHGLISERLLQVITANNDALGLPLALVVGFYFSGGMLEGALKAYKNKGLKF